MITLNKCRVLHRIGFWTRKGAVIKKAGEITTYSMVWLTILYKG